MQIAVNKSINLALNENQYGVAPQVQEALSIIDVSVVSKYRKETEFKKKLIEIHNIDAANIYITNGAEDALQAIFDNTYLKTSSSGSVLVSDISWSYYFDLAQKYVVPLDRFSLQEHLYCYQFDVDTIVEAVHKHNPSIVLLDSPHNPVGCQLEDEQIVKIYSAMSDEQILVIDETYFEFSNREDNRGELVKQLDNVIFIRSFSKYYGLAGLRIGYMLLGKGARAKLNLHDNYLGYNVISDRAASVTLDHRSFYAQVAAQLQREKERFFTFMQNIEYVIPYQSSANFLLVRFSKNSPVTAKNYVDFMAKNGIKLKLYSQGKLANSIRISIGTPEQMDYLKNLTNIYFKLHQFLSLQHIVQ